MFVQRPGWPPTRSAPPEGLAQVPHDRRVRHAVPYPGTGHEEQLTSDQLGDQVFGRGGDVGIRRQALDGRGVGALGGGVHPGTVAWGDGYAAAVKRFPLVLADSPVPRGRGPDASASVLEERPHPRACVRVDSAGSGAPAPFPAETQTRKPALKARTSCGLQFWLPLALLTACHTGRVQRTEFSRTIEEYGVILPVAGPMATGPQARAGAMTAELDVVVGIPREAPEVHYGDNVSPFAVRGHLGIATGDYIEMGIAGTAAGDDVQRVTGSAWAVTTFFNARPGNPDGIGLSVGGELGVMTAPFRRTQFLSWYTTDYSEEVPVTSSGSKAKTYEATAVGPWLAAHAGPDWHGPKGLWFGAGGFVQSTMSFPGVRSQNWSCERYADGSRVCNPRPNPASWEYGLLPGVYANLGQTIGKSWTPYAAVAVLPFDRPSYVPMVTVSAGVSWQPSFSSGE